MYLIMKGVNKMKLNRKITSVLTASCVIMSTITGITYAAENDPRCNQMSGASINNEGYRLDRYPETPINTKFKLTTSCGKTSKTEKVAGVMWYDTNRGSAECDLKGQHFRVERGNTKSVTDNFKIHTTHYQMGVYAGMCRSKNDKTGKGTGSTLAVEK